MIRTIQLHRVEQPFHQIRPVRREERKDGVEPFLQMPLRI
jgi:hypothetical protein